jgi:hypothetical protein
MSGEGGRWLALDQNRMRWQALFVDVFETWSASTSATATITVS